MRQFKSGWRSAPLQPADAALLGYAEKLTRAPASATAEDLDALRAHGFDDTQIHDAVQVISYFNYINRIADGLGVDLESSMNPRQSSAEIETR